MVLRSHTKLTMLPQSQGVTICSFLFSEGVSSRLSPEEEVCSCLWKGLLKHWIPGNGILFIISEGTFPGLNSMESIRSCSCKRLLRYLIHKRRDFLVDGRDFQNALAFRREHHFVPADKDPVPEELYNWCHPCFLCVFNCSYLLCTDGGGG
ncbi:hypothetical protein HanIR_Chr06g0292151 [Helianthus annuus]|nr:hypothetical protein HanIR_Chr06g0292151 [Helianthus annuus]